MNGRHIVILTRTIEDTKPAVTHQEPVIGLMTLTGMEFEKFIAIQ
jgi:hypothetical protein